MWDVKHFSDQAARKDMRDFGMRNQFQYRQLMTWSEGVLNGTTQQREFSVLVFIRMIGD